MQIICSQTGLTPNHWSFDFKLLLMLAACAAGCYAQFNPTQFPENKTTIVLCVILYFIISSVYQCIVWFVDKDYVFVSKSVVSGRPCATITLDTVRLYMHRLPQGDSIAVCLRTQMHKYSDTYTVIVEQPKGSQVAKVPFSVGQFFTEVCLCAAWPCAAPAVLAFACRLCRMACIQRNILQAPCKRELAPSLLEGK
jgi:hypothetical protein